MVVGEGGLTGEGGFELFHFTDEVGDETEHFGGTGEEGRVVGSGVGGGGGGGGGGGFGEVR
jgi:hypothetical protein